MLFTCNVLNVFKENIKTKNLNLMKEKQRNYLEKLLEKLFSGNLL